MCCLQVYKPSLKRELLCHMNPSGCTKRNCLDMWGMQVSHFLLLVTGYSGTDGTGASINNLL